MTFLTKSALGSAALALLIAAPLTAVAQSTESDTTAAETAAAEEAVSYDADSVVATAGGTKITLGELVTTRASLPEQYQALPDEVLMTGLLDQIIDQTLLEQAARETELDQDPSIALVLRNQARLVLAEAYISREVEKRLTDALIQEAYDEAYGGEPVNEINAGHILVASEDLAQQIKTELDGGAEFAALAAQHGTDGTASRGGSLGWFVHGDMVQEFADAAFALEPGEVSDPVKSAFGWHIIKVEDRRPRPAPPIEQVRVELVNGLTTTLQQAVINELKDGKEVVRTEPALPAKAIRDDALISGE